MQAMEHDGACSATGVRGNRCGAACLRGIRSIEAGGAERRRSHGAVKSFRVVPLPPVGSISACQGCCAQHSDAGHALAFTISGQRSSMLAGSSTITRRHARSAGCMLATIKLPKGTSKTIGA